jgi:hypothetical protein
MPRSPMGVVPLLVRYLDQGLGRVEQATREVGTVDTPLAQLSREERNASQQAEQSLNAWVGEDAPHTD